MISFIKIIKTMKFIYIFCVLITFLSCEKQLPERPADYNNWYNLNNELEDVAETTIPCDSQLVSNYYETELSLSGFDSYNVSTVQAYESFDSYTATANHGQTTSKLVIEVFDKPKTIVGRKTYQTTESNFVSNSKAKLYFKTGAFTEIYFYPVNTDSLYVDYYNDSVVFSFCSIELKSSNFNNTSMFLTGRIVAEF